MIILLKALYQFYFNILSVIFGGHFDYFIKSVVSVLFQYSERRPIQYHNYVETWVSNLRFIKFIMDYNNIGPEMT